MSYADENAVLAWLDAGKGEKLPPMARKMLTELAVFRREDTGVTWRHRGHAATRWGVGEETIKRAMRSLRSEKLIAVAEKAVGQRSTRYRFTEAFLEELGPFIEAVKGKKVGEHQRTPTPEKGNTSAQVGEQIDPSRGTPAHPDPESSRSRERRDDESDADSDSPPLGLPVSSSDWEKILEDVTGRLHVSRDEAVAFIEEKAESRDIAHPVKYFERTVSNELASRGKTKESTGSKSKKTTKGGKAKKPEAERFPCPECAGQYTKQGMGSHRRSHRVRCPSCGGPYLNPLQLEAMQKAGGPIACGRGCYITRCAMCEEKVTTVELDEHRKECSKNWETVWRCSGCGKEQVVRGDESSRPCECGKRGAIRVADRRRADPATVGGSG